MAGDFDSAWLKFGWAVWHSERLVEEYAKYAASGPGFSEVVTFDQVASEFVLSITNVVQPPPTLSLHLADTVGSFRQCLDHVAWVLVQDGTATDAKKEKSYFVLVDDPKNFSSRMAKQMPGVSVAACEIVERLHRRHIWVEPDAKNAPLMLMRDLNNSDKHRTLQVVTSLPSDASIEGVFSDCIQAGPFRPSGEGPLVDGCEIARVGVTDVGANPTMQPVGSLTTIPTIEGFSIVDLFNHLAIAIDTCVLTPLQPVPPAAMFSLGTALDPSGWS